MSVCSESLKAAGGQTFHFDSPKVSLRTAKACTIVTQRQILIGKKRLKAILSALLKFILNRS